MKKFILLIDSLVKTFSIIESGTDIAFSYKNKDDIETFKDMHIGDIVLGYFSEPINQIKCIFEVQKNTDETSVILTKELEVSNGVEINFRIAKSLEENILVELSDSEYNEIINLLYQEKKSTLFANGTNDAYCVDTQKISKKTFNYLTTKGVGINKIFYGTPGCGKSYHIQHNILEKENYEADNIIRTTFYQDYSNTDFVGQILPKIVKGGEGEKDSVEYIFNPGPFTLALIQAINNPNSKVALVVEEINRGNAPAIFGDIFQLLDRDENGISEYGIVNVGIMGYLNDYVFEVNGEKKQFTFKEIKIPGNMSIYATMNTSDQNVYTLDTAFVRRWEKEKIKNNIANCTFANTTVPGMDCTWKEFVEAINEHIAKHLEDLQVNEDKQIGAYFVKESLLLSNNPEKFAYKVFDYLWSDVAKLDHSVFFKHYDTLDDLIDAYKSSGVSVFKSGIFDKKEPSKMIMDDDNNE